jgi:hypothetical protein
MPRLMNARRRSARPSPAWQAANPAPVTELEYATPFQLLIAVILSAQATDKSVNIATRKLFADAPTPRAMLALGEAGLAEYINRIGLYRNKAKNVIATCRQLLERMPAKCRTTARSARSPARRGPQDGQRRAQHGFRRTDHRRGHAHLPRRQPHGAGHRARTPLAVETQAAQAGSRKASGRTPTTG